MEAIKSQYSDTTNDEDNISNLPDLLIHHILSFVDMKQAVQTCILSKRWTTIWTSLPFLRFEGYVNSLDFVEYVLGLRDNRCFDIRRFHLLGGCGYYGCDFIKRRLRRWIMVVARTNVEDIDVEFCGDISDEEDEFEVPSCVSTCKSLTKLKLYLSKSKISLPNSISLPRLGYLKLYNPSFDHDSLTKLCTNCPVLEHLDLSGIRSFEPLNINISSHTLKHLNLGVADCTAPLNITISSLSLKHFEVHIDYYESICNTLRLYAPNLVHLVLQNLDYMLLEDDVSSLVTADVGVRVKPRELNHKFRRVHVPDTLESLKSLHNVKNLTMSWRPLKDVRRVLEILQKQPFQFSNLERLKLQNISLSTDAMHAIASLVKISPIIESLELKLCQDVETGDNYRRNYNYNYSYNDEFESDEGPDWGYSYTDELEDWGSEPEQEMELDPHTSEATVDLEGLLADTMKQLKSVEISGLQGSDGELEFIQILIKNAMVLKKMALKSGCRSKIDKFYDEVKKIPSACSTLRIICSDSGEP